MKIAVIIIAYNRPKYLKKCLESINFKIDFAFVDYSDKQVKIQGMLIDKGVGEVICRRNHFGLARNIIFGVTEIFNRGYDAVIVLEDDVILHPRYYEYMRDALICNEDNLKVGSVSGYCYVNENYGMFLSLGWGTWKDRWEQVSWKYEQTIDTNFNNLYPDYVHIYEKARAGKIDSWAIRFAYHHYIYKLNCIHPNKIGCLVKHIGKNGTHVKWYSKFGIRPIIRKLKEFWRDKNTKKQMDNLHHLIWCYVKILST